MSQPLTLSICIISGESQRGKVLSAAAHAKPEPASDVIMPQASRGGLLRVHRKRFRDWLERRSWPGTVFLELKDASGRVQGFTFGPNKEFIRRAETLRKLRGTARLRRAFPLAARGLCVRGQIYELQPSELKKKQKNCEFRREWVVSEDAYATALGLLAPSDPTNYWYSLVFHNCATFAERVARRLDLPGLDVFSIGRRPTSPDKLHRSLLKNPQQHHTMSPAPDGL